MNSKATNYDAKATAPKAGECVLPPVELKTNTKTVVEAASFLWVGARGEPVLEIGLPVGGLIMDTGNPEPRLKLNVNPVAPNVVQDQAEAGAVVASVVFEIKVAGGGNVAAGKEVDLAFAVDAAVLRDLLEDAVP